MCILSIDILSLSLCDFSHFFALHRLAHFFFQWLCHTFLRRCLVEAAPSNLAQLHNVSFYRWGVYFRKKNLKKIKMVLCSTKKSPNNFSNLKHGLKKSPNNFSNSKNEENSNNFSNSENEKSPNNFSNLQNLPPFNFHLPPYPHLAGIF